MRDINLSETYGSYCLASMYIANSNDNSLHNKPLISVRLFTVDASLVCNVYNASLEMIRFHTNKLFASDFNWPNKLNYCAIIKFSTESKICSIVIT